METEYLFTEVYVSGVRQPNGGTILFDIQCHIAVPLPMGKIRASWDRGVVAGERLIEQHVCGASCDGLCLLDLTN
jgi:hypothetical protein